MDKYQAIRALRDYKERHALSLEETGNYLGCSVAAVAHWLKGQSMPSKDVLKKIMELVDAGTGKDFKVGQKVMVDYLEYTNVCGTIRKLMNNSCIVDFDEDHLGTMPHLMYEQLNACGVVNYRKAKPLEGNI